MATVQVTFKSVDGSGAPLENAGFTSNQTFASSGTSQATTAAASNNDVMVINTDGDIRFKTGATPTAIADDTCELVGSGRHQFAVNPGDKCAIIDA